MGMYKALASALVFASVFVFGSNGFTGTARAGDPDPLLEKLSTLEKKVDADATAKANEALIEDAKAAANLYKDSEGKVALQDRALAIVGGLTKVRVDSVAKAALLTLGSIGDLKGAKYLRSFLRPVDEFKVPVAVETSIDVAKLLPDTSLVEPLIEIVDASKNVAMAAKAIDALGSFGAVKNKREKILVELCKSVQRNVPGQKGHSGGSVGNSDAGSGPDGASGSGMDGSIDGGTGSYSAGQAASARWPALSESLPGALNKLTGTVCASAQDWFSMVKSHKSSLKVLFVNDEAVPTPPAPK